jgi:TPP-dependent indolepyruvate ferredoxin oxidoreductase alpha subunit
VGAGQGDRRLEVADRAFMITSPLENVGIARVTFEQPFASAQLTQRAQRDREFPVSTVVVRSACCQLSQHLVGEGRGYRLTHLVGEVRS